MDKATCVGWSSPSCDIITVLHMQDIVPTMPKFKLRALGIRFSLFKRTGLRVHLSDDELITVRPSLMEARLGIVFSCATPDPRHPCHYLGISKELLY